MNSIFLKNQQGVALLTALLVVSLATITVVGMVTKQRVAIRRSANFFSHDQSYLMALGGESWARGVLSRDGSESTIDGLSEDWAQELPPMPVTGGEVSGRIEDLQGRFNLNNLIKDGKVSEKDLALFKRLLTTLELDSSLADVVVDWLDADQDMTEPGGLEELFYLGLSSPIRPGDQPLKSVTELRLMEGMSVLVDVVEEESGTGEQETIYDRLTPLVTVLPEWTAININTAPQELLMALGEEITRGDAESLVSSREMEEFASVSDFIANEALAGRTLEEDLLAVSSSYFGVQGDVRIGDGHLRLKSLIHRDSDKTKVLSREQGRL
ncbi:MAG: type II secretion system minor pseudopilin GspK [Magnetococcales bacterium]|nr:type II secretion system minor pseudopilin GspK [Magnetococcales bacterium]